MKQVIHSVGARLHYIEGISPNDSPDSVLLEGAAGAFAEYYSPTSDEASAKTPSEP